MEIRGLTACLSAAKKEVESAGIDDAEAYYGDLEAALQPVTRHLADSWSARSSADLLISPFEHPQTDDLYECVLGFDGWSLLYEVFDRAPIATNHYVVWRGFVWVASSGVCVVFPSDQ